jgi:phosphomevalonate kinase
MGNSAGVEIEPDQQTILADATERVAGVLCAGVPGAGGVDAIFAVTLSKPTRDRVETMWSQWSRGSSVCPLLLSADRADPAGVKCNVNI